MHRSSGLAAMGAAFVLVVSAWLGEPSGALARRGQPIIISETLVLKPSRPSVVVCQDEAQQFAVDVYVEVIYRLGSDSRSMRRLGHRRPTGTVRVQATPGNAAVTQVSPPFADTSGSPVTFEVTGDQVGSDSITIVDTLGLAQPASVRVRVVECAIKIKSTSIWHMNFNYALTAYGTMPEITLRRSGPNHYVGRGAMHASASATSIGGCTPRYKVGDFKAIITGDVRPGRSGGQVVDIDAIWAEADVKTTVTCLVVGGGNASTGQPEHLHFPVPAFNLSRYVVDVNPHMALTGRGPQPGSTQFVIWTEEVVPPPP